MSPEMVNEEVKFSAQSDIWALGCVLVEILSLQAAFTGFNMISIGKKIVRLLYSFLFLLIITPNYMQKKNMFIWKEIADSRKKTFITDKIVPVSVGRIEGI